MPFYANTPLRFSPPLHHHQQHPLPKVRVEYSCGSVEYTTACSTLRLLTLDWVWPPGNLCPGGTKLVPQWSSMIGNLWNIYNLAATKFAVASKREPGERRYWVGCTDCFMAWGDG